MVDSCQKPHRYTLFRVNKKKKAPQSIWSAVKNILSRGVFKQITGLAVQQLADHLNV